MGLLGIIITSVVMILGAGYFFLGSSGSSLSVENPVMSQPAHIQTLSESDSGRQETDENRQGVAENRLSVGMEAIEKAKEISQQITENSKQVAEEGGMEEKTEKQGMENTKQETKNDQNPQSVIENLQSKIENRLVSFGFAQSSGRKIDTVVLHSSYNNQGGDRYSVDKVIGIWKSYEVAPHYMIDRKGNILRLVKDQDIAYHAGNSKMPDGRTSVNGFSIGVEILNAEDDEYTSAQYGAVNDLITYLKQQYGVKYVVGHDDIAPGRKTDPWNFDWKKLK